MQLANSSALSAKSSTKGIQEDDPSWKRHIAGKVIGSDHVVTGVFSHDGESSREKSKRIKNIYK